MREGYMSVCVTMFLLAFVFVLFVLSHAFLSCLLTWANISFWVALFISMHAGPPFYLLAHQPIRYFVEFFLPISIYISALVCVFKRKVWQIISKQTETHALLQWSCTHSWREKHDWTRLLFWFLKLFRVSEINRRKWDSWRLFFF